MDNYLSVKPNTELLLIVNNLRAKVQSLKDEITTLIDHSHFDVAESHLPVLHTLCTVLCRVESTESFAVHNSLQSLLRERRLQLSKQIPEKLEKHHYRSIADILNSIKGSNAKHDQYETNLNLSSN